MGDNIYLEKAVWLKKHIPLLGEKLNYKYQKCNIKLTNKTTTIHHKSYTGYDYKKDGIEQLKKGVCVLQIKRGNKTGCKTINPNTK